MGIIVNCCSMFSVKSYFIYLFVFSLKNNDFIKTNIERGQEFVVKRGVAEMLVI